MPKNYLEQLLLNLETLTAKDQIVEYLKKNKPYQEMDDDDYLNQIISGIDNYIHTYLELDSKEDVAKLKSIKTICIELKNKQETKEDEYPFLDGKGRFKIFFEGLSLEDIKSLKEKELSSLLRCIQNELGNELIVKDIEPINHTNAIFGTKFVKKKLGDLAVVYYREKDYTVIVGVKRNEGLNTDYTRYDLVAKSLPGIELSLKKYAKGILEDGSNHYRTIKFLKNYLNPEEKVSEKTEESKDPKEDNVPKDINKSSNFTFEPQIISPSSKHNSRKYFQWDMISDEIKSHLTEEFISDYTTVLDYYKKYGTINVGYVDKDDTDAELKEKKKIREITKKWKRGIFKKNASLLQIKLIDNLEFDWTLNEQVSHQTDTEEESTISLTPIALKTLESKPKKQVQKESQTSSDSLNILKPIPLTTLTPENQIPAPDQTIEKTYTDRVIDVLVKYYEDYGNTNVMSHYKVPETGFPLGKALNEIREDYHNSNLTERQIKLLESMNFNFDYSKEKKPTQNVPENHDITSDEYKNIIKRRLLIKFINQLDDDKIDDAIRAIDSIANFKVNQKENERHY